MMVKAKLNRFAVYISLILVSVVFFTYANINIHKYERKKVEDFYYFPTGKYVEIITFGFNNVIADLLWMDTLSYVGTHIVSDRKYDYLYHMLDIITRINPYFKYPYHFAGSIMPWELHDYERALKILRRGNRYRPDDWFIWFQEGFIYMYFLNNYKKAAYYFKEASKNKECPEYIVSLAAKLTAKAYNVDEAIKTFTTMYKETKEEHIKERLRKRLQLLYAEKNFQIFEKAVKEYKERFGRPPMHLNDLVNSGILKSIPKEPFGGKYYIDKDGKVRSTVYNKRIEIYRKGK